MVCIPCIILPVALWFYCKFLQPFILRWMPPTWRTWLDNWLYPTCPVKLPPSKPSVTNDVMSEGQKESLLDHENGELKHRKVDYESEDEMEDCCGADDKKSPLVTLERNHIAVGGPDKKID